MTELERRKQQLRIDSGQDSQSTEEMVAKKESLQYSLDELRARLEVIESEKAALTVEEDQQYAAESSQQVKVVTLQKKVEALNKEMEAKKATIAENEETVTQLEVRACFPTCAAVASEPSAAVASQPLGVRLMLCVLTCVTRRGCLLQ